MNTPNFLRKILADQGIGITEGDACVLFHTSLLLYKTDRTRGSFNSRPTKTCCFVSTSLRTCQKTICDYNAIALCAEHSLILLETDAGNQLFKLLLDDKISPYYLCNDYNFNFRNMIKQYSSVPDSNKTKIEHLEAEVRQLKDLLAKLIEQKDNNHGEQGTTEV